MTIDWEWVKIIRAILFGATVTWAGIYIALYFKSIAEDISGGGFQSINLDIWWIVGVSISVIVGILIALVMISL